MKRTSGFVKLIIGFMIFYAILQVIVQQRNDEARRAESERVSKLTPEQRAVEEKMKKAEEAKRKESDALSTAVAICRQGSKQLFKDPSSVSFPQMNSEVPVEKKKDGTYLVQFQARAKNSFNATVLSIFNCRTAPASEPGKWNIISIKEFNR